MGYRNARDELKHRIVIDGLLNSMLPGESVVITDYSIFDPEHCLTEGTYWFSTEYRKVKKNLFLVYRHTSSKYRYCSRCGKFSCCGNCGKRKLVSQKEVIKAIQAVYFSPEYRIEYRMENT